MFYSESKMQENKHLLEAVMVCADTKKGNERQGGSIGAYGLVVGFWHIPKKTTTTGGLTHELVFHKIS